jgi:Dolichyl-phosphate-mannose-protein mannosyltransferase
MKNIFQKNHRVLFYASWLIIGLIQSYYTELLDDEAYYWVFSRFLDWGYFDHPPMIALMIKAGYAVFHNELGVRIISLLLNIATLFLLEKLIAKKNDLLFYAIAFSLAVIQIGGILAVPDSPLIFFTALFFWCYKKFTENSSSANTILLGIVAACLLYSKYHGVLIIFFVLISNFKLFTNYKTYLAGIIALVCFVPHLIWQYNHDWVSFRYHLFESNVNPYKFSYTTEYIAGQLLLAGPIAGIIIVPAAILYKTKSSLEKALKFTLIGLYVFFLISSFRGRVEANWTSAAIVPLVILSHQFLNNRVKWRKVLYYSLPVTIVLVLAVRVAMIKDIVPVKAIKERFHSWHKWPQQMKERTKGLPVAFNSSYQRASKYWFYSGQVTYSPNWYRGRKNNYNFWPVEDSLLGKPVYILDVYNLEQFKDSMNTSIGTVGYRYDSAYASFTKVKLNIGTKKIILKKGEPFNCKLTAEFPKVYYDYVLSDTTRKVKLYYGAFIKNEFVKETGKEISLYDLIDNKQIPLQINVDLPPGKYFLRLSLQSGINTATHNSDKIELVVIE